MTPPEKARALTAPEMGKTVPTVAVPLLTLDAVAWSAVVARPKGTTMMIMMVRIPAAVAATMSGHAATAPGSTTPQGWKMACLQSTCGSRQPSPPCLTPLQVTPPTLDVAELG